MFPGIDINHILVNPVLNREKGEGNEKGICCFLFAVLLSVQYLMPAKAADAEKEFEDILEEQLRSTVHYYSEDSFSVIDAYGMQGQVTKVVAPDDPQTSQNEEEIEEYSSHIGIVFWN